MRTTSKSNSVKVTVVGPGYGEAIIISVGTSFMIGIDSCLGLLQLEDDGRTVIQRIVDESISADAPIFWVLSHLHRDHFDSFSSVLNLFGDRMCEIITPFAYTEKTLWNDVIAHDAAQSLTFARGVGSTSATEEYERILKILESDEFDDRCQQFSGVRDVPVGGISANAAGKVRVTVLGPNARLIRHLVSKAVRGIITKEDRKRLTNAANEGSYFVHMVSGEFEGLFLADAKSKRVEDWLERRRGTTESRSFFLKVAHHGSNDGTTKRLLDLFCRPDADVETKTAVVAPYISNRLPTKNTLDLLTQSGYNVVQTATKLREGDRIGNRAGLVGLVDGIIFDGVVSGSSDAYTYEYSVE